MPKAYLEIKALNKDGFLHIPVPSKIRRELQVAEGDCIVLEFDGMNHSAKFLQKEQLKVERKRLLEERNRANAITASVLMN